MKRPDLRPRLAADIAGWCRERAVRLAVLYGSRARDEARPESDTDLAFWPLRPVPLEELLQWKRELSRLTGIEVQVTLATPDLDPVLGMQIAREGIAVFEPRPGEWLEARVRLWQAYQDALPFLRAARDDLRAFVEEVRDGS